MERPAQAIEGAIYTDGQLLIAQGLGLIRLTGVEGQTTRVMTLGSWDEQRRMLTGLPAVCRSGRWIVDASSMKPAAAKDGFESLASSQPDPDYWLGQPASVVRMSDEQGAFLRIRVPKPALHMGVYSGKPIRSLDDAPMTARAQVRIYEGQVVSFWADDITHPGGAPRRYQQASKQTGRWIDLTLRIPRTRFADPSDRIGLEINRLNGGDCFDIRYLEGYVGILP